MSCSFLTIAIKDKDNYEVIRTETVWLKEDTSDLNDIKSLSHENNINNKNETMTVIDTIRLN